jgi:hypothetical protein
MASDEEIVERDRTVARLVNEPAARRRPGMSKYEKSISTLITEVGGASGGNTPPAEPAPVTFTLPSGEKRTYRISIDTE